MNLDERIARRMYEAAHPRSPQWNDASLSVRKKWLFLGAIALDTVAAYGPGGTHLEQPDNET